MAIKFQFFLTLAFVVRACSGQRCFVCGDGFRVGRPDAIVSFQGQPDVLCNHLEFIGIQGLIPIDQCFSLPPLISETCNCQTDTTVKRHRGRKLQNTTGSSSPAAVPTYKPVTATATPTAIAIPNSPTARPTTASPVREVFCEVCGDGFEVALPYKWVNFSDPDSPSMSGRCDKLKSIPAACKYYRAKIQSRCGGCEYTDHGSVYSPAYAPAYFGGGVDAPTNQPTSETILLFVAVFLGLPCFVCLIVGTAGLRRAQERAAQNVIETPQRRQAAELTAVVANGRSELDAEEALKRRHLTLMILFPMEGKVRLVPCLCQMHSGFFRLRHAFLTCAPSPCHQGEHFQTSWRGACQWA
jgi:hypothetical protein